MHRCRRLLVLTGGLLVPLLLLAAAGLSGCNSSRSPTEIANDRADVLGTWKYRANGSRLLDRGTLQIHVRDGHLTGKFRDRWHGTVRARVMLDGPHMAFTLDRARISGRIRSGRFEGAIRRSFWNVSEGDNEGRPPATSSPSASIGRRPRTLLRTLAAPPSCANRPIPALPCWANRAVPPVRVTLPSVGRPAKSIKSGGPSGTFVCRRPNGTPYEALSACPFRIESLRLCCVHRRFYARHEPVVLRP